MDTERDEPTPADEDLTDLEPDEATAEHVVGGQISTVLKSRHDTAKNSVSNIR